MQLFLNGTTQRIVEVAEDATVQTLQNIIALNDGLSDWICHISFYSFILSAFIHSC